MPRRFKSLPPVTFVPVGHIAAQYDGAYRVRRAIRNRQDDNLLLFGSDLTCYLSLLSCEVYAMETGGLFIVAPQCYHSRLERVGAVVRAYRERPPTTFCSEPGPDGTITLY